jgi:hypothetical protein
MRKKCFSFHKSSFFKVKWYLRMHEYYVILHYGEFVIFNSNNLLHLCSKLTFVHSWLHFKLSICFDRLNVLSVKIELRILFIVIVSLMSALHLHQQFWPPCPSHR